MKELPKTYEPRDVEDRLYKFWVDNGYFHAERDPDKKPFTIVMPPPNVTGQLHMGHAMDAAMQDVLIRFKRMQGYSALWIPGVDHAGIATQIRVEEELRKEGKTRYDLGREKFLERVWAWKHQYGDRIVEQQKRLGASCDWDRARFTMDEGCSKAVREVFVNLYEQGLIYKGSRIINWCPHCVTALSDAEVEYVDKPGHLWHVRYPLADGSGEVIIATTRPETMLGDTGVAVSPKDPEKAAFVGKTVKLPIVDREIPIFEDWHVDANFGSGFVKVTPAHDPNDYAMGQAHDLPQINIFDEHAVVVEGYGEFTGMTREECREAVIKWFDEHGLLDHVEEHDHSVMHCYRCDAALEPWLSEQWFVAVDKLKGDKAVEALKELIVSDAKDQYSEFEDKLGSEGLRQLERRVVLAVLDRKWREHLYEMDYLKDGIGLRGMGQRDPLVEYQREGYQMYNSMIEAIKEETIQLLFHVDIERVAMTEDEETESDEDEAVNAAEAVMGLDGESAATGESAPAEPETDDEAEKTTIDELADEQKNEKGIVGMQPISHAEGKVPANKRPKSEELHSPWADGRTFPGTGKNAQCPCGSGRKYKMCHGQNEA